MQLELGIDPASSRGTPSGCSSSNTIDVFGLFGSDRASLAQLVTDCRKGLNRRKIDDAARRHLVFVRIRCTSPVQLERIGERVELWASPVRSWYVCGVPGVEGGSTSISSRRGYSARRWPDRRAEESHRVRLRAEPPLAS